MIEAILGATTRRKSVEEWTAVFDGSAELSEGLHALHMVMTHEDRHADGEGYWNAVRWMVKQLRREAEAHHQSVLDHAPKHGSAAA